MNDPTQAAFWLGPGALVGYALLLGGLALGGCACWAVGRLMARWQAWQERGDDEGHDG